MIGIRRTVKDAALLRWPASLGAPVLNAIGSSKRSRGDHAAHRGGESPGHRAGDCVGKIWLGLEWPVPARVPAEVKELVLKTVDDGRGRVLPHLGVLLWQVSDSRVHRWQARCRDTGTLVDRAPGGHPMHALLPGRSPRS